MAEPRDQAVRDELQRVLVSPVFLHSDRLRRFLTHCVESALSGRVEELKEYTIGLVAFDRPKHYNPAEDPIVRVEARRLRKKLDEYYQSFGAADPLVIQLPKGGYLPVFEDRPATLTEVPPVSQPQPSIPDRADPPPRPRRGLTAVLTAMVAIGVAASGVWWVGQRRSSPPEFSLTRLTSTRGLTTDPALSQDGSLLVYASDRASNADLDIWIQPASAAAAAGTPHRLTDDPADDSQPAVSPDGSMVAFRSERRPAGIYLVSTSGGSAKLIVPDGRNPRYSPDGQRMAYWVGSPGGDSLPPAGKAYVMSASGGSPGREVGNFAWSACPIWSPDSSSLLVEAGSAPGDAMDFWAVGLDSGHTLRTGVAQKLDQAHLGLALRDCPMGWGKTSFIFSIISGETQNLWRLPVMPDGRPNGRIERFTFGSAEESLPFEVASGAVAFAARSEAMDVWRLPVDHPDELARITEGISTATFPQVRGHRLVYLSRAEGKPVLWMKDLDNRSTVALTHGGEPRYPQVCPDGQTVVYSDGPNAFAVTPESAGAPRLLCNGCSRVWQCNEREVFSVPAGSRNPLEIDEFPLPAGPSRPLVADPAYNLASAQKSSDGWLAFHAITGTTQRQIYVARYRAGQIIGRDEWSAVTDGWHLDRTAVWNDRADTLYFLSERCGFRCIWAQRLDAATKKPLGSPVAVRHFHSARQGLSAMGDAGAIGLSFSGGSLYFSQAEQRGEIWLARPGRAER